MGMSASQARLLSLTARLSDLEYEAQSVSNSKIQLSQSSEEASTKYMDALDKQKLTVYNSETSSYEDATAYNLTTYGAISTLDKQRMLKTSSGQMIVSQNTSDAYDDATSTDINFTGQSRTISMSSDYIKQYCNTAADFLEFALGYTTIDEYNELNPSATTTDKTNAKNQINYYTNVYTGAEGFLENLGYTSNANNEDSDLSYDASAATYYTNVFNEISSNGKQVVDSSDLNDYEWLYNQLNNGAVYISEYDSDGGSDGTGDWENVSWDSGDSTLAEKDDDTYTAKAEAEYNTTMAEIDSKDKRYDLQLKSIDTEHNAIQTEIDSVKKVIDKNIDRSFKIFDA